MKQFKVRSSKLKVQKNVLIPCSVFYVLLLLTSHFSLLTSYADENPLNRMIAETVSYFKPMTGRITMVEDKNVMVDLGIKDSIKAGMRFNVLREGAPFIHPVTKEPLGKLELSVGRIEIKEAGADSSTGTIIAGDIKEGDKVRISETKVNMLFCQSKDVDWYLADSHYRGLKGTGRFNMIDTGIETDDPSNVIIEAKKLNAEVALLLTAKAADKGTLLTERLLWVSDGSIFAEIDVNVDVAYIKELRFAEELFAPHKEEAWLQFDLPFGARLITTGDIDGDGKQEILLSTGKDISAYTPRVDFQPALGGLQIKGSRFDDHLWIDTIDLNGNKRDEVIVTLMRGGDVVSYIYELKDTEFTLLYKDNLFLRKIENGLIAQAYSSDEGFKGEVFSILWEGGYKRGSVVKLPEGVNIYDFVYIDDLQGGRLIFAYDGVGFLNMYNDQNIRIWRSKADTGGFLTTFKKATPSIIVDRGEWAIKDRLFLRNRGILLVKRIPLLEIAKGLGYKSSQIKKLWWNGLSMEEGVFIDDITGSILDYAIIGDKIIALTSPMFGVKPENILKGENPLRTVLYIYSIKGK